MITGIASGTSTCQSTWRLENPMPTAESTTSAGTPAKPGRRVPDQDQQRVAHEPDRDRRRGESCDRDKDHEQRQAGDRVEDPGGPRDRSVRPPSPVRRRSPAGTRSRTRSTTATIVSSRCSRSREPKFAQMVSDPIPTKQRLRGEEASRYQLPRDALEGEDATTPVRRRPPPPPTVQPVVIEHVERLAHRLVIAHRPARPPVTGPGSNSTSRIAMGSSRFNPRSSPTKSYDERAGGDAEDLLRAGRTARRCRRR